MYLAVKTGSADETEVMGSGLSHYLEHMLFKGTARRKAGQIEDEVRQMGGSTNAYTSYDLTVYYVDFLSSHFTAACDLMSDVIFHSELPQEEMERERQVILGEFRMNEDRLSRKADVELWRLAFQTHPYGHPVIGYDDLFRKVTRDDLMADLRAVNAKLRDRAVRIVATEAGVPESEARDRLEHADWDIRKALE